MFTLRCYKGVRKFEKLHRTRYISLRLQSTESVVLDKDERRIVKDEIIGRRFLKPVSVKKLKVFKENFVRNLFAGVVDKSIFQYPAVLRTSELDIIINHSSEIESFLTQASKDQLTEDTIRKLRDLELFGLSVPQKYGGAGYNETETKFLQECMGANSKIGRFLGYNENFGCKILNLYGTEEQKEKYLPRLAQGKSFVSFAYLENDPLIDLLKIDGLAITDEVNQKFILQAEKKWVHDADKADLFFVFLRAATFLESDVDIQVKFNLFIVERETPGVTVHRLKSEYAKENNLYDVSFKDVVINSENLLGSKDVDGHQVLKSALSHSNVTDAALCCHLLKHIIYEVIHFINERKLIDSSATCHSLVQENLANLVLNAYALESVIYLLTGRFDEYDNPDLFYESIFAKILAVEFLQTAIKNYIEILGRESVKSSGILEEAMKTMQYYSTFEENTEYLKIMGAIEGMIHAGVKLQSVVKILRNPFDHNWETFKRIFNTEHRSMKKKLAKQNFKVEVPDELHQAAISLDESYAVFLDDLENLFIERGATAIENEHIIVKFGEMAAYLYAFMACLARASNSICYDFEGWKDDALMAQGFGFIANSKIKELHEQEIRFRNLTLYYTDIGKETFNKKGYPIEHPLTRTF